MPFQVLMAYSHAARMRDAVDESGNPVFNAEGRRTRELEPSSPTRPATARDCSTWWSDVDGDVPPGAIIREA